MLLLNLFITTALAACPSSTPSFRNFFYIGGGYDTEPDGTHLWRNQMYVEHLSPVQITQSLPIILIHGQGQSGTVSFLPTCATNSNSNPD